MRALTIDDVAEPFPGFAKMLYENVLPKKFCVGGYIVHSSDAVHFSPSFGLCDRCKHMPYLYACPSSFLVTDCQPYSCLVNESVDQPLVCTFAHQWRLRRCLWALLPLAVALLGLVTAAMCWCPVLPSHPIPAIKTFAISSITSLRQAGPILCLTISCVIKSISQAMTKPTNWTYMRSVCLLLTTRAIWSLTACFKTCNCGNDTIA